MLSIEMVLKNMQSTCHRRVAQRSTFWHGHAHTLTHCTRVTTGSGSGRDDTYYDACSVP